MKNKTALLLVVISSISFFQMDCKKEPPIVPPDQPKKEILLILKDTTCTEAWLQLTFKNYTAPHNYKIYRDTTLAFSGTLFTNDTTLIDTSLLPQRNYNYKVLRFENGIVKDSSKLFQIKTMDTTSHEFSWTFETIGFQNSIVRNIAIVNDTLVYAVGKFYEKDTNTNSQTPYNIARWNGKRWELLRVMVETRQIPPTPPHYYYPDEIYGIHAISPNEIWLATSIEFIRWDGESEKGKLYIYMLNTPVQTVWATKSDNIFGAGVGGTFVIYDGITWTKLDSLTSTTMTDIFGTSDGKEVWATGWDSNGKCAVLRYRNNILQKKYEWDTPKSDDFLKEFIRSVWINKNKIYLPSSSGFIYTYSIKTEIPTKEKFQIQYFPYSIRGSSENNIMIACEYGMLYHFNGSTWKLIDQLAFQNQSPYGGVAVSKNLIVVGGARFYGINYSGFVLMGKKY